MYVSFPGSSGVSYTLPILLDIIEYGHPFAIHAFEPRPFLDVYAMAKATVAVLFSFGPSRVPVSIFSYTISQQRVQLKHDYQTMFTGLTRRSSERFNSHLLLYPSQFSSTLPAQLQSRRYFHSPMAQMGH